MKKFCLILKLFTVIWASCATVTSVAQPAIPNYLLNENWDQCIHWDFDLNQDSQLECIEFDGINGDGLEFNYHLSPSSSSTSYVRLIIDSLDGIALDTFPVVFLIKAESMDDLEIKFEDTDGSVYQKRYSMNNVYRNKDLGKI